MMFENDFRHVPVIENDQVVGMVSARNALDPELEEFVAESNRREQIRRSGN
jgi:predicted transcriptional regulator